MAKNSNRPFEDVVDFIVSKHRGQVRSGIEVPYCIHCFGVLRIVAVEWGIKDRTTWDVCLCHDLKEDCGVTHEELVDLIGEEGANTVDELTFKPERNHLSLPEQKAEYMKSFFDKSTRALVIKLADRCDNTLDFLVTKPDYASKYWKKAEPLLDAVLTREFDINEMYGMEVTSNVKYAKTQIHQRVL